MNRQEIIERLKLIQAGLTQDDNNKSKNRIDAVIENLKQPITLADFLGWEENVEYEFDKKIYKVIDNNLYSKFQKDFSLNLASLCNYDISRLRQAKKVRKKRFNLILQKGYRKLFDLLDCEKYLTMDIDEETIFNSKYSNDNSKYQVRFTLEEIKDIKKKFKINLSIYDVVEVQE
jgi:hypothetical protein|nr:MAG TPA: hypothetical protein [Caudoviricetes sp.]